MTTHIKYENGRLYMATANGTCINFRACDLQYSDRMALTRAVSDINPVQQAGEPGFLRTQPVEGRENVLEEILGIPMSDIFGGSDNEDIRQ